MRVIPVPCLSDNYAYLVICEATNRAAIVDPSEADPVTAAIAEHKVELAAIWNTHHHWDHTGGNKALLSAHPHVEVIGHASDKGRIPGQTTFAEDGDTDDEGEEDEDEGDSSSDDADDDEPYWTQLAPLCVCCYAGGSTMYLTFSMMGNSAPLARRISSKTIFFIE